MPPRTPYQHSCTAVRCPDLRTRSRILLHRREGPRKSPLLHCSKESFAASHSCSWESPRGLVSPQPSHPLLLNFTEKGFVLRLMSARLIAMSSSSLAPR